MLFDPYEISRDYCMCFHAFCPQRDFLTRCHACFLHNFLMGLPYKISAAELF
jgi:hypothetical protein